ncbi:MAG TPA: hypothetical protein VF026_05520, partial [Ktedonobacteraceae bacterium]
MLVFPLSATPVVQWLMLTCPAPAIARYLRSRVQTWWSLYAALPYAGNDLTQCYGLSSSPNHDAAADSEISITSHEQMEAATDPEASGWFGPGGLGDEIGDKCAGVYGPLHEDGADVFFKGHPYIVQEEWDNAVAGCVLSG